MWEQAALGQVTWVHTGHRALALASPQCRQSSTIQAAFPGTHCARSTSEEISVLACSVLAVAFAYIQTIIMNLCSHPVLSWLPRLLLQWIPKPKEIIWISPQALACLHTDRLHTVKLNFFTFLQIYLVLLWTPDISKTLTHSSAYSYTLCQGWQWNTKPQQIWRPNFDECKFPQSSTAPFTTVVSPLPNILCISALHVSKVLLWHCKCFI